MSKVITVFLILIFMFSFLGCENAKTASQKNIPAARLDFSYARDLEDEEYSKIKKYIYSVEREVFSGDDYEDRKTTTSIMFETANLGLCVSDYELTELCKSGLAAFPVLFEEANLLNDIFENEDRHTEPIYAELGSYGITYKTSIFFGAASLLQRIPNETSMFPQPNSHQHIELWKNSTQEIINIIDSKELKNEEKVLKLWKYGLRSVPYAIKEIEKGHIEYEKLFMYLGLHKSSEEWTKIFFSLSHEYESNGEWEEEKFLKDFSVKLTADYEDFDYKDWLCENEDDLNMILKYMDELCAEYEAEQNTK